MAVAEVDAEEPPKKKGMLIPLVIGLVLAGAAGFGGYWAVTSGPLASDGSGDHASADSHGGGHGEEDEEDAPPPRPDLHEVAFVALDPVVINLGTEHNVRHLLFTAQLEVAPEDADEVAHLSPRVMDVLNSYLRVIDLSELSEPHTLARLRAQLLRRVQIVTGDILVRDLLVTEFVVN